MSLVSSIAALLGISTYALPASPTALTLDSKTVEESREAYGGQIQPIPYSQTRWYLADLETAERQADNGDLAQAARLMRSARKDGQLSGVLSTRTSGLVRLPKKFSGNAEIVAELQRGGDGKGVAARSVFEEMFPSQELALMAGDGELLGVAVGEMVPVAGRDFPVLVRLDPEFLTYRWSENRWYFRSIVGLIPITPGDGRWILHTPGGRNSPWQNGLWRAIGGAYIRKEHAKLHKDNWEAKLANPARVAIAPQGATEPQAESFFRRVMAWGINTVFGLTPGYDVKLLESNGRGFESFNTTIAESNRDYMISITGQTVTTDGGTGFANADIHKAIRADLIKATADALAYTINTQGIPPYVLARWGEAALYDSAVVEWDVTPAKDKAQEAATLVSVGSAIKTLSEALAAQGRQLDVEAVCANFNVRLLSTKAANVQQLPESTGVAEAA